MKMMPRGARFLQTVARAAPPPPPETLAVDSDVVVILAALLCALICVVGLALVARCAWLRHSSASSSGGGASLGPAPAATKGLKKKVLRALPKVSFDAAAAAAGKIAECAICLAEFAEGEEIRILPQCGHGFHVACIDTWLGSHSSCPSCRRILVASAASRCRNCGSSSAAEAEGGAKARQDSHANDRFLP